MKLKLLAGALCALAFTSQASAANLAIFGNNNIATLYGASHTVTIVTDAQIATAGFLDSYDAFVFTRNGSDFGIPLTVAAAAAVKNYVAGNIILFNGDFQDDIGAVQTDNLFNNALDFVLSNSAGGYIGEYIGSFSAFASNDDGYSPIGLVEGHAGVSGFAQGGSEGDVLITAAGLLSPVTAGVGFPYNPGAVEYSAAVDGVNPAKVLARFENGNAAIIAGNVADISDPGAVPEPSTWAMMLLGFGAVGGLIRSRRSRAGRALA